MKLSILPKDGSKPTYTGEVHAVGVFRVLVGVPSEEVAKLVEVNGASLLFGAIRELVLNLSGRGPWPAVCLSTVSFATTNAIEARRVGAKRAEGVKA